jgi:drug/metabolite transporter (DMT)-like permease
MPPEHLQQSLTRSLPWTTPIVPYHSPYPERLTIMKTYTLIAIALIAAGILALVYGRFTYTKDTDTAKLGPIQLTVTEKETVNLPDWAGAGAIVAGAAMLVFPLLKR